MVGQRRAPRRILYVDMAPSVGGSVISLYHLVKGLDRARFEPCVVLRNGSEYAVRFQELGVVVRGVAAGYTGAAAGQAMAFGGLRKSGLASLLKRARMGETLVHTAGFYLRTWPELRREALALRRVMVSLDPDLVHLNDVVGVSRSGIMAARAARLPAICHLRALASRTHFDRCISHSLRGCICISKAVDRHQRALGGKTAPSWVVYNGIDLDEFGGLDEWAGRERDRLRRELGFGAGDFVVGCLGRIRPWKGQHVLLMALGQLVERHGHLRGLIVGAPEVHQQEYGDQMRGLARDLGLEGRVIFAGYRADVPQVLRAMDLMVHASVRPEPFGRVIIESMAASTPVVATDGGAVPEIIEDRVTGLLVQPDDVDAMASGIERAMKHSDERIAWARAAREVVQERFTVERYVSGIERVYEEILDG